MRQAGRREGRAPNLITKIVPQAKSRAQRGSERRRSRFRGPATETGSASFTDTYKARFKENPIAAYHLNGYDAALMLMTAMEKAGVMSGETVYIPRQALREALYNLRGLQGQSGVITCSPTGDCASANIQIFQVKGNEFSAIYP